MNDESEEIKLEKALKVVRDYFISLQVCIDDSSSYLDDLEIISTEMIPVIQKLIDDVCVARGFTKQQYLIRPMIYLMDGEKDE